MIKKVASKSEKKRVKAQQTEPKELKKELKIETPDYMNESEYKA